MRFRLPALVLLFLLSPGLQAGEEAVAKTVLGPNPDLADGSKAMMAGDFEEGIRLTLRGLRYAGSGRNRAGAYSNLCAGYAKTRQYETAIEYCDRALELRPDNWQAYHNRAYVLLGQGNVKEAIRDAEAGLEIAPEAAVLKQVLEVAERLNRHPTVIMDRFPRESES